MSAILPYKGTLPTIDPSVYMVDSSVVIGDSVIGADSSLWFNVVVRGDVNYIRIGERTNVQDNSVLHVTNNTHPLVIGSDVTIGHSVTLHGCTIKDRCLIGMGAIILDGAVIGEDCLIGAGALVTENTIIEQGSLVIGMPAKVKRKLTEKEVARILKSSRNYMGYVRNYREGGTP